MNREIQEQLGYPMCICGGRPNTTEWKGHTQQDLNTKGGQETPSGLSVPIYPPEGFYSSIYSLVNNCVKCFWQWSQHCSLAADHHHRGSQPRVLPWPPLVMFWSELCLAVLLSDSVYRSFLRGNYYWYLSHDY